jgi:Zn finger protein HypA/HybF involved in hydrogenase expression
MIRVRRYESLFRARSAAEFLRTSGVPATVLGEHLDTAVGMRWSLLPGYDVHVGGEADRARAEALLDEFEQHGVEVEAGWESAAAPDLSRLADPTIDVTCPHCSSSLPLDASLERCPVCRGEIDVPTRIAEQHGPEALTGCYEDESVMRFALGSRSSAACGSCGRALEGLSLRGRCPECGALYDRSDPTTRRA